MKKFIIITSINEPTKAIEEFARLSDWQLIVVGDKKTPSDWSFNNAIYLSPEAQRDLCADFSQLLPWNHYSRKMMGYLYAIKEGADIIADSDDDNIPLGNWGKEINFNGEYKTVKNDDFLNIYKYYTREKIWPRGFPLPKILNEKGVAKIQIKTNAIGVWQGLANKEADVDAIYRLTINKEVYFDASDPIVLAKNTICPFNSQNTFFRKELFPLLYLPAFVSFRFTDILRGLIAQPVMWGSGYNLGFLPPSVNQDRNDHNFLDDFESEVSMYLQTENVFEILKKVINKKNGIVKNLEIAYLTLHQNNIVTKEEVELLSEWLNFFEN